MGRAKRVVFALRPFGEAGKAVFLPQRTNAVTASGQDLVRVALVADIEDQPVIRRIENLVDGDGQLHHAQPRTQMAAGLGNRINHLVTHFTGELRQFAIVDPAQISGPVHLVQKGRIRGRSHGTGLFCSRVREPAFSLTLRGKAAFSSVICRASIGFPAQGKGTNSSSSPGTISKRPVRHSFFACSIRSLEDDTKFHQI